jgi:hypothetical protein
MEQSKTIIVDYREVDFDELEESVYAHMSYGVDNVLRGNLESYTTPFLSMGDVEKYIIENYEGICMEWQDDARDRDMHSSFTYEGKEFWLSQFFGSDVVLERA